MGRRAVGISIHAMWGDKDIYDAEDDATHQQEHDEAGCEYLQAYEDGLGEPRGDETDGLSCQRGITRRQDKASAAAQSAEDLSEVSAPRRQLTVRTTRKVCAWVSTRFCEVGSWVCERGSRWDCSDW